jgi:hypothetical protein
VPCPLLPAWSAGGCAGRGQLRLSTQVLFLQPIFVYFLRASVCWPLLCLCRPFCIFERWLNSNPESSRNKQALRYQLSHPSFYLATYLSNLATQLPHLTTCL